MALGQVGKPNNILLDSLLQLNDLIKSLNSSELADHINELKAKTQEYNAARSSAEPTILALQKIKEDSEKAEEAAKQEKIALLSVRSEHENSLNRIAKERKDFENAKAINEKGVITKQAELEQKEASVAERERKAEEKLKQAEAKAAEYEKKLGDLKKITG